MADVFLSYSHDDRIKIARIAQALEARGWSVWWDRSLKSGDRWSEEISRELRSAKCVVVAWSDAAINSNYVREEAGIALAYDKFLPVSLDQSMPPIKFAELETIDLSRWLGSLEDENYSALERAIERLAEPNRLERKLLSGSKLNKNRSRLRVWGITVGGTFYGFASGVIAKSLIAVSAAGIVSGIGYLSYTTSRFKDPNHATQLEPRTIPLPSIQAASPNFLREKIDTSNANLGSSGDGSSSCAFQQFARGYLLENGRAVFDKDRFSVLVSRMAIPVFKANTGEERDDKNLNFSDILRIEDPGQGHARMLVRDAADRTVGWINRIDLLCNSAPLVDPVSGLVSRAVTRPVTAAQGMLLPQRAFHHPDKRCEGGNAGCPHLLPLGWYYIYAEEQNHYLISEFDNLSRFGAKLFGWLPRDEAFPWNTSIGLRPSEESDHVCGYRSKAELHVSNFCVRIFGGKGWFTTDVRMLLLKEDADSYEVIAYSTTGSAEFFRSQQELSTLLGVRFFIPKNADVVWDILISHQQLGELVTTLDNIQSVWGALQSASARRETLVKVLLAQLSAVLAIDFASSGTPLSQLMRGLPKVAQENVLRYTIDELRDVEKVPNCEIDYLLQYVSKKHDALRIVLDSAGTVLAQFAEPAAGPAVCPNMSEKGKNVPLIVGAVRPIQIDGSGALQNSTIRHTIGDKDWYWTPLRYLP